MLKKFVLWFIVFGLSFLASDVFGLGERGLMFLYINIGFNVLVIVALAWVVVIAGIKIEREKEANAISFILLIAAVLNVALTLFVTWVATKLFAIDFCLAYQIMTFGACLFGNSKKDN